MKKMAIRTEVESALRTLGFKPKQWRWGGCTLDLVVGGEFRSIRFPAGMSKRAVSYEIGRIVGWVEAFASIAAAAPAVSGQPKRANGAHVEVRP